MSILFKNANLLIRNDNGFYEILKNGYLGVNQNQIDYVSDIAPNKKYEFEKDYSHKLLMPGLVNNHTHIPMVLLRGLGGGHNLQEWLNDFIFPTEAKLTAKQIKWASYYAILEMLASGTTSFTDMYFFPEETAQAVIDSGIKANLNKYITCFDDNQTVENSGIPESIEFFKKYNGLADGRLIVDFSIHAEYTNKPHIVKEYSKLCKEYGARMHIHLSETKAETEKCKQKYGLSPTQWFESLGTFENKTVAAHCVWVDENDCDILKKHNVSIALNPSSNMYLGSGFAPMGKFQRKEICLTLGTDGTASNNNLNMFEEMNIALLINNGFHLNPSFTSDDAIIDMATINGFQSQDRTKSGLIREGMCADIIAIDLDKIHLYPSYDIPLLLVSSAQASDVCMTMVDGKILYENGQYLTLDKDLIISEFKGCVKELNL